MQYFRPGGDFFAGDAMPFFHDGVFHLFYLLDENHHQAKGGLGGHQWAHATTTDLAHWTQHPLALPITESFEGSICTGSLFYHAGTYYAFYATRRLDRTQHLSLATSRDGIHFQKTAPNPLASPGAGYSPNHYRDPFLFRLYCTTARANGQRQRI
jgi:sucrose-6-phosphate hydrolase SacC (GH32 family)